MSSDEQRAPDDSFLRVNDDLFIPRSELTYRATRAGGPGGQHVNTSSTRVELFWDVAGSPTLTDHQRQRILSRLANRISQEGLLQLSDAGTRSQHRNREAVTERLAELLAEVLVVRKPRKKTRPTKASRERTRQAKERRAETKRLRGPVTPD
jgi:ribosome-associated protein